MFTRLQIDLFVPKNVFSDLIKIRVNGNSGNNPLLPARIICHSCPTLKYTISLNISTFFLLKLFNDRHGYKINDKMISLLQLLCHCL